MEIAVHSAQVILVALASYLFFTIARLSRQDTGHQALVSFTRTGQPQRASRPLPRIESIAQLQMFASNQLLELKLNGLQPHQLRRKDWLFKGVCHYFFGACREIGRHFECADLDISDMMHFVLRRNLGLDYDEASRTLNGMLLQPEEEYQREAAQTGATAASAWLQQKRIPADVSLFTGMNEWGMTI